MGAFKVGQLKNPIEKIWEIALRNLTHLTRFLWFVFPCVNLKIHCVITGQVRRLLKIKSFSEIYCDFLFSFQSIYSLKLALKKRNFSWSSLLLILLIYSSHMINLFLNLLYNVFVRVKNLKHRNELLKVLLNW